MASVCIEEKLLEWVSAINESICRINDMLDTVGCEAVSGLIQTTWFWPPDYITPHSFCIEDTVDDILEWYYCFTHWNEIFDTPLKEYLLCFGYFGDYVFNYEDIEDATCIEDILDIIDPDTRIPEIDAGFEPLNPSPVATVEISGLGGHMYYDCTDSCNPQYTLDASEINGVHTLAPGACGGYGKIASLGGNAWYSIRLGYSGSPAAGWSPFIQLTLYCRSLTFGIPYICFMTLTKEGGRCDLKGEYSFDSCAPAGYLWCHGEYSTGHWWTELVTRCWKYCEGPSVCEGSINAAATVE